MEYIAFSKSDRREGSDISFWRGVKKWSGFCRVHGTFVYRVVCWFLSDVAMTEATPLNLCDAVVFFGSGKRTTRWMGLLYTEIASSLAYPISRP